MQQPEIVELKVKPSYQQGYVMTTWQNKAVLGVGSEIFVVDLDSGEQRRLPYSVNYRIESLAVYERPEGNEGVLLITLSWEGELKYRSTLYVIDLGRNKVMDELRLYRQRQTKAFGVFKTQMVGDTLLMGWVRDEEDNPKYHTRLSRLALEKGRLMETPLPYPSDVEPTEFKSVLSSDGRLLAVLRNNRRVGIWDIHTGCYVFNHKLEKNQKLIEVALRGHLLLLSTNRYLLQKGYFVYQMMLVNTETEQVSEVYSDHNILHHITWDTEGSSVSWLSHSSTMIILDTETQKVEVRKVSSFPLQMVHHPSEPVVAFASQSNLAVYRYF